MTNVPHEVKYQIKYIALVLTLWLSILSVEGQHQQKTDSLINVLEKLPKRDTSRLRLLRLIANNHTDSRKKLAYANMLMEAAEIAESAKYMHYAYLIEGRTYQLLGDFDVAIYSLFKALAFAERSGYKKGIAESNAVLADVYSVLGSHRSSVSYYKKALRIVAFNDSAVVANILLNMGDEYYMSTMYDSALVCFRQSKRIYESLGENKSGIAYNLGNMGLVQAELGLDSLAEENFKNAFELLSELEDHYGMAIFSSFMSEIYNRKGQVLKGRLLADSSRSIYTKNGLETDIVDKNLRLADLYAMHSDYESGYKYREQFIALKDSISNDEITSRVENLESAFELAKKQKEVNLLIVKQENQRIIIAAVIVVALIFSVLALVIYRFYRSKARINIILEHQKKALESLNETKDKFFSIISHDLRGPISSFHGVSGMIKYFVEKNDTEQLLEVADEIDKSVDGLSSLLDNLLKWAMQQQGHFPNVPEKLNLKDLCDEIIMAFSNMSQGKGIDLVAEVNDELFIWADKNAAMTIIRNLVNNALKFTEQGGRVSITSEQVQGKCQVSISDTGIGIPAEKLEKIFRLQDTKSTYGTAGEKGLGLGLQLVKEFADMVGGQLQVKSEQNKGTTFTVSFLRYDVQEVVANAQGKK